MIRPARLSPFLTACSLFQLLPRSGDVRAHNFLGDEIEWITEAKKFGGGPSGVGRSG